MIQYQIKSMSSYLPLSLAILGLLAINLHKSLSFYTVTLSSKPTILNFAGFANPITTTNIESPVDGIVNSILINYGEPVKKGEVVFLLQSKKMEGEFREAVQNYVKAKSTYQNSLFKFNGNQELFKLGLISKLNFEDSENELKSNELALWNTELEVKKNLNLTGIQYEELQGITMEDIDKIREIMQKAFRGIKITSPQDGILLFSSKTLGANSDESQTGPVHIGSPTKQGQILAVVANMTGLILEITVNETNFKNVFEGQKASVTGPAFGNIELEGKVIDINHQANSADFNSTPTYTVHVSVPKLNEEQRKAIQVGMSTQVSLVKENPPTITIPLQALIEKDGQYTVQKRNPQTKKLEEVNVTTGETDVDSVQILQGLSVGDEIAIPN